MSSWNQIVTNLIALIFPDKYCYNEHEEKEFDYYEEIDNPYKVNSWAYSRYFCIRCGSALEEINRDNPIYGSRWKTMLEQGTLDFLCSNKQCYHNSTPLTLHHPDGITNPPSDYGYSLGWRK